VGVSADREIPNYFEEAVGAPVSEFASPQFVRDKEYRGVRVGATVWNGLTHVSDYRSSLDRLEELIQESRPHLLINFYELLGALYLAQRRPAPPAIIVGHQFLMQHPGYQFPPGHIRDRLVLRSYNRFLRTGAAQRWALSYYDLSLSAPDDLIVMPPLLRPDLFEQEVSDTEDFLLVYLLNEGYLSELITWHLKYPLVELHVFCRRQGVTEVWHYDDTLTVHPLSNTLFLNKMASARAVVCTAGFESTAEAMYLRKPVFMVPVERHYEQYCNAHDAEAYGAGLRGASFQLDRFLEWLPQYDSNKSEYRTWVDSAGDRALEAIARLARGDQKSRRSSHPDPSVLE
jgi:uncharacterized protein (TIGR00661 family)